MVKAFKGTLKINQLLKQINTKINNYKEKSIESSIQSSHNSQVQEMTEEFHELMTEHEIPWGMTHIDIEKCPGDKFEIDAKVMDISKENSEDEVIEGSEDHTRSFGIAEEIVAKEVVEEISKGGKTLSKINTNSQKRKTSDLNDLSDLEDPSNKKRKYDYKYDYEESVKICPTTNYQVLVQKIAQKNKSLKDDQSPNYGHYFCDTIPKKQKAQLNLVRIKSKIDSEKWE